MKKSDRIKKTILGAENVIRRAEDSGDAWLAAFERENLEKLQEKKHGGRRENSGRPAIPTNQKKITFPVRLDPDQVEFLKTLPNAAEWVREAINEKRQMNQQMMNYTQAMSAIAAAAEKVAKSAIDNSWTDAAGNFRPDMNLAGALHRALKTCLDENPMASNHDIAVAIGVAMWLDENPEADLSGPANWYFVDASNLPGFRPAKTVEVRHPFSGAYLGMDYMV